MKCLNCKSNNVSSFYEIKNVPIHNVMPMPSKQQALDFPTADINLVLCDNCELITNALFDSNLHNYCIDYNPTQAHSPTFNTFHKNLAEYFIAKYDLHHKTILEIGCGEGEFIHLLCELGDNQGVAFDPAYGGKITSNKINFIADFFSRPYTQSKVDFICCKMTLEHIHNPKQLLSVVKDTCSSDTIVFFQIPDATHTLKRGAFWDIYYEHCNYFTPSSLAKLFTDSGFKILDLSKNYGDQYLTIEVQLGTSNLISEEKIDKTDLDDIQNKLYKNIQYWNTHIQPKTVIWGGGSKGVGFLTTLNTNNIDYVVDIDPIKHGTFMAGTGQQIVAPLFLTKYQPSTVIVMNPIYLNEINEMMYKLCFGYKLVLPEINVGVA